ncbi:MAG: PsbP-related protein [Candidatus Shapirobacteria bacterium]|nr:PsbP-related protein [Candidatus Shapirobacteria bacterium]
MENINTTHEAPSQSFITPTPPIPQKNIYKPLFFIFFVLFLIVTSISIILLFPKGQSIPQTSQINESVTPTSIATPTSNPTSNFKTYINKKYGYSIKYLNNWAFREFPDLRSGAGFKLISDIDIDEPYTTEFIVVDARGRDGNHFNTNFDEYVKVAGTYEIEGYESLASIKKITTDTGLIGYETTWIYSTRKGTKATSLPITYFNPTNSSEYTVQVSLNDENYIDDYHKIISTFTFDQ